MGGFCIFFQFGHAYFRFLPYFCIRKRHRCGRKTTPEPPAVTPTHEHI